MNEKAIHHGSHAKKILTKGVWYFFSSLFVKAVNLFLLPIVTRYFSPAEYGILSTLDTVYQLLPVFISLSLDEAYFRFYFNHNKDKNELKDYVSTYFWIILGWGIIVVSGSIIIGKIYLTRLLDVPFFPFIPLTMIGPLLLQLGVLGGAYLRQELKAELLSLTEILSYFVYILSFMFLLIFNKLGIKAKIYGLFLSNAFSLMIFSWIVLKKGLIGFRFSRKVLIEGLKYSIPLLPNQMSAWITGLSDRLILTIYKTLSDTGIYSIGYQLGETLRMLSMSVFKVYTPIMYSMLVDKKKEGIKRIERFMPFYFVVMFWGAFCLGLFAKEFLIIFTSVKYHSAFVVVPIVAFAYLFGAIYKPFLNLISFHNKTWIISAGAIFQALSNIIFNLIFIPAFGKMAAAWTTFGSNLIYLIWIFLWSQKLEKVLIDWKKILLTLILGLIMISIYIALNHFFEFNFMIGLLVKITIVVIGILASIKLNLIDLKYAKLKS